jgi:hypothetical protein
VRLSEINLNSGGFLVHQPVGLPSNIQDLTVGLNWYPDIGIRFMANWVSVLQLAAPFNRSGSIRKFSKCGPRSTGKSLPGAGEGSTLAGGRCAMTAAGRSRLYLQP